MLCARTSTFPSPQLFGGQFPWSSWQENSKVYSKWSILAIIELMVPLLSSGKSGLQPICLCFSVNTRQVSAESIHPVLHFSALILDLMQLCVCVTEWGDVVCNVCILPCGVGANHKLTPPQEIGVTLCTAHWGTLVKTYTFFWYLGEWARGFQRITDWFQELITRGRRSIRKNCGKELMTWLLRPPLSTHMPTWQSIALKARSLNSFTQANSENKGAVKSPFTSEEGRRGARGASSKPGHFPKKSLHPREFKSPG